MANRYRFTDGSSATSVSGSGPFVGFPWDTGITGVTARARPTTRQGLYDELVLALQDAGWTEFVQTAGADSVWFSTGEDGNQAIVARTTFDGRYIGIWVAPKLDASNLPVGGIGGGVTVQDRVDLGTSDRTMDFHVSVTLDRVWFVAQQSTHLTTNPMFVISFGNLEVYEGNPNILVTNGAAAAGSFVSIPFATNPLSLGYRAGDVLQIVEQTAASSPLAETFRVVDVTTTTIVADSLSGSYTSGARVGTLPCPVYRVCVDNDELEALPSAMKLTTPYHHGGPSTNDLVALDGFPSGVLELEIDYGVGESHAMGGARDAFGVGTTPNQRSLRFTCRSIGVKVTESAVVGVLPGLFAYPGTVTYFPHDDMLYDRVTPNERYVPLRFTATSSLHYMMGPTPS